MKSLNGAQARDYLWIKRLIWSYFFLLIFEGALRKWVLPSAANALLIIRDPVVLAAYFLAWRSGLFPRNAFIGVAAALGIASLTAGLLTLPNSPAIVLYGFRTDFLQIPFIFLVAKIFNARDVERLGYWTLVIAIPMAALMALQFLSPKQSFINSGADDSFAQIDSAMGRIRPPGTFSFISGPIYYYSLVVAFLLYNSAGKRYPLWLMIGATLATLCALAVSGSRSLAVSIAIVFIVGLAFNTLARPALAFRWGAGLIVVGVMGYFLSALPFFQSGVTVFTARVQGAAGYEGGALGFLARFASGFTGFIPALFEAPLFGQGLGMGTNVGLALMTDKTKFIWFEDEWGRHVLESGPLLGGAFICYRVALTAWIGAIAARHAARRDPLPILLYGACFISVLNGLIGQATTLGFVILLSGLALAATRVPAARTRAQTEELPEELAESAVDARAEPLLSS